MTVTIELHELLIEAAGIVVRICQRVLRKTMTALSQLQPGLLSWFGNIIIVCVTYDRWLSGCKRAFFTGISRFSVHEKVIYKSVQLIYKYKFIALMMEAVGTSEISVYFHETTLRYTPESCHLYFPKDSSLQLSLDAE
jgi:hypothetical protein